MIRQRIPSAKRIGQAGGLESHANRHIGRWEYETFTREVEAVAELNKGDDNNSNGGDRDLSIVYFEDWFVSRNFVCIVMQYADGGTLSQEIERKVVFAG